jgi:hypothetical protein
MRHPEEPSHSWQISGELLYQIYAPGFLWIVVWEHCVPISPDVWPPVHGLPPPRFAWHLSRQTREWAADVLEKHTFELVVHVPWPFEFEWQL